MEDEENTAPVSANYYPELKTFTTYHIDEFSPVTVDSTEEEVTIRDLNQLNAHLAYSQAMLPHVRTLQGLIGLSNSVCKLIETRRHVKKLPFGDQNKGKGSKTFEIIE